MFSAKATHLKYTIPETNLFKKKMYFILQKYLINIYFLNILYIYS